MPKEGSNSYTVSLWDLATWSEVDVVVDERLPCKSDGRLLGCTPSVDGELWVCYLEKALAVHCGGWDKIDGGQCTHAWALLTGCKEQYTMQKTDKGAYKCLGKYNPNEDRWEEHANSPHEGFSGLWPMAWPEAGGGGAQDLELSMEELFARMCVWDDKNYIMGAGTKLGSDYEKTDGIVDGHAYSVLQCEDDVAGTGIDLIQMRNPWGKGGELENSEWTDDGAGWQRYPAVKAILNPVLADDGTCGVSPSLPVNPGPGPLQPCVQPLTGTITLTCTLTPTLTARPHPHPHPHRPSTWYQPKMPPRYLLGLKG